MLVLDGVTIELGGRNAVEGLDLAVGDREIVGLIGPKGAGKTTLLDCITGLYRPSAGRVLLGDKEIQRLAPHRIAGLGVGRTFERLALFPGLSVHDNVTLGRQVKQRSGVVAAARHWGRAQRDDTRQGDVVERVVEFLDLQDLRGTPVGALSSGLRKRVELGRALALEPQLLLLDEATSEMTVGEKEELVGYVRRTNVEMGVTLLFVSHDIGVTTELCDRVAVLDGGRKIAEGPPEVIRQDPRVLSAYLGGSLVGDAS